MRRFLNQFLLNFFFIKNFLWKAKCITRFVGFCWFYSLTCAMKNVKAHATPQNLSLYFPVVTLSPSFSVSSFVVSSSSSYMKLELDDTTCLRILHIGITRRSIINISTLHTKKKAEQQKQNLFLTWFFNSNNARKGRESNKKQDIIFDQFFFVLVIQTEHSKKAITRIAAK